MSAIVPVKVSDPNALLIAREKYRKDSKDLEVAVQAALEDKEVLLEQLSYFVLNDRQKLLVAALTAAKAHPNKSVNDILLTIPMSPLEFINILREVRMAFSNFQTREIIDVHRPKVVEAVMQGALPVTKVCVDCEGEGKLTVVAPSGDTKTLMCKACAGEGKVTSKPDHARQVTALEVAGVIKKGGAGVAVTVNTSGAPDGWRSSPDFRRETDRIMYEGAVDVEVVEEKGEEEEDELARDTPEDLETTPTTPTTPTTTPKTERVYKSVRPAKVPEVIVDGKKTLKTKGIQLPRK